MRGFVTGSGGTVMVLRNCSSSAITWKRRKGILSGQWPLLESGLQCPEESFHSMFVFDGYVLRNAWHIPKRKCTYICATGC